MDHDHDRRYESEREFHNATYSAGSRGVSEKYYSISGYSWDDYYDILWSRCKGKQVLEYGCGTGSAAFLLAEHGAIVTGIDISEMAIRIAQNTADELQLKVEFCCMNTESTTFEDGRFDLICGTGVLHHLDLDRAYGEVARILAPEGSAVFVEPMGHNPFINLYRALTPSLRSKDEHPLKLYDLEKAKEYFQSVKIEYYYLFPLLALPFRRMPFFGQLLDILNSLDDGLFRIAPWIGRYAWHVLLEFSGPRNK